LTKIGFVSSTRVVLGIRQRVIPETVGFLRAWRWPPRRVLIRPSSGNSRGTPCE
jgi:hypothetical protein